MNKWYRKKSFSKRLGNTTIAFTVIRYTLWLFFICFTQHTMWITFKLLRIVIFLDTLLLLWYIFWVSSTRYPRPYCWIWDRHALEIWHIVLIIFLLRFFWFIIIWLLMYFIFNVWAYLSWKLFLNISLSVRLKLLVHLQYLSVFLLDLSFPLFKLSLFYLIKSSLLLSFSLPLDIFNNLLWFQCRKRNQFELISSCNGYKNIFFDLDIFGFLICHFFQSLFGKSSLCSCCCSLWPIELKLSGSLGAFSRFSWIPISIKSLKVIFFRSL